MMMRILFMASVVVLLSMSVLSAADMKSICAYPVPYNPKAGVLKIGFPTSSGSVFNSDDTVYYTVHDVNGDQVATGGGAPAPGVPANKFVIWNGRNSRGNYVKPGLYIIRVTVDSADGGFGKKVLRIVVNY
jgi:hypothetical protein